MFYSKDFQRLTFGHAENNLPAVLKSQLEGWNFLTTWSRDFFKQKKLMNACYIVIYSHQIIFSEINLDEQGNVELLYGFLSNWLLYSSSDIHVWSGYTFYFVTFSGCVSNTQTTLFSFFSFLENKILCLAWCVGWFPCQFLKYKTNKKRKHYFFCNAAK